MAEFDEYEYLERQLEKPKGAPPPDSYRNYDDRKSGPSRHEARERRPRSRSPRREGRGGGRPFDGREGRGGYGYRDGGRGDRGGGSFRDRGDRKPRSPQRREGTPPEMRAVKEKERELAELERDTRTVFAYNLNLKANERDVFDFFSKAGRVNDVKLITDKTTRKSKGFAYIEYSRQEDVLNSLALTGQVLMGQAVMVKSSEAEKNLAWEAQQQAAQNQAATAALLGASFAGTGPCKLQVTNLHTEVSDNDLKPVFEVFGPLDFVQVVRDLTGRSQGTAYVQFKQYADASKAMTHWHNRQLAGLVMKVTIATVSALQPGMVPTLGDLDEDDEAGGGLRLTSAARTALMNRLANSAGLQTNVAFNMPGASTAGPGGVGAPTPASFIGSGEQGMLGPASPIPTPCLLIKNMFDAAQETDPNWDVEIANDVREECSKFGSVIHVFVDRNSKGHVYIKLGSAEAGVAAHRSLHGRFFAGKQIVVEYQFLQPYKTHFHA